MKQVYFKIIVLLSTIVLSNCGYNQRLHSNGYDSQQYIKTIIKMNDYCMLQNCDMLITGDNKIILEY